MDKERHTGTGEELGDWFPFDDHPIDRKVAEDNPCPECGGQCRYQGFSNPQPAGGNLFGNPTHHCRAFAVCEDCGVWWEF